MFDSEGRPLVLGTSLTMTPNQTGSCWMIWISVKSPPNPNAVYNHCHVGESLCDPGLCLPAGELLLVVRMDVRIPRLLYLLQPLLQILLSN